VKEFLSREGHEFTTMNVEEDDSAYEALLALGFRVVPVTIVNGQAIRGFDQPALRAALTASRP
jgi:glutaredoxin